MIYYILITISVVSYEMQILNLFGKDDAGRLVLVLNNLFQNVSPKMTTTTKNMYSLSCIYRI